MNDNEAQLDTVYRVYPAHGEGGFLEVLIDGDEMVRVHTTTEKSELWFGKVCFTVEKAVAKKLAEALRALT